MKSRIMYLDLLRAMAAIAVVFYHCGKTGIIEQLLLVFLNWCVPIFLMITGAVFFLKKDEIKLTQMIRGPVIHILSILAVWGMIYNIISLIIMEGPHVWIVIEAMQMVLVADTRFCYQFWYLYMLVGLYIAIPILKPWADRNMIGDKPNRECIMLFGFVFLVSIFIPTLMQILGYNGTVWKNGFVMYSAYAYYMMCGYGVFRWGLGRNLRLILGGTWAAQAIWIGINIFRGDYAATTALYGYTSVFTWEMSVLLFDLVRRIRKAKLPEKFKQWVAYISYHSMGIYVLHVMVLMGASKIENKFLPNLYHGTILYVLFMVTLTVFACIICSCILKKMRLMRLVNKLL